MERSRIRSQFRRVVPIFGQHLDANVVAIAVLLEGADLLACEQGSKRASHLDGRDAEIGGATAIDVERELRSPGLVGAAHVLETRVGLHAVDQLIGVLLELREVRPANAVLDLRELAASREIGIADRELLELRHGCIDTHPKFLEELLDRGVAFVLARHVDRESRPVRFVLRLVARDREHVAHLGMRANGLLHAHQGLVRHGQRCPDRELRLDLRFAEVVLREVVHRHGRHDAAAARDGQHALPGRDHVILGLPLELIRPRITGDRVDLASSHLDCERIGRAEVDPQRLRLVHGQHDTASLHPGGRYLLGEIIDQTNRESTKPRRQRVDLVVVRDPECPQKRNVQLRIFVYFGKGETANCCASVQSCVVSYQFPSLTFLTICLTCFSGTDFSWRIIWANSFGRARMMACNSVETLPAMARSMSGSSPSASARATILASEGGGVSSRSTLLR